MKIRTLALVLVIAWLAAGLTLQLRPSAVCIVGAGTDLACARGFETREHDGRRPFRWSDGYAEVHLPGAGLAAPGVATIVLRSGRPAGALPVPVQFGLNGRQLVAFAAPPEERRLRLLLPSAGLGGDLARLQFASATWQPDVRRLGVVLAMAGIEPLEGLRLPGPRLALAWLALLLSAWLVGGARHPWLWALLFVLLLSVAWLPQIVFYLPVCALIAGLYALAWQRLPAWDKTGPLAILLWAGAAALPYLLLILDLLPAEATLPALAASVTLAVVAAVRAEDAGARLILGAGALRLALLLARLLSGHTHLDHDVELFYSYGMALREIGLPEVEYPSGALLPWAMLSWMSGNSREAFALLFPMLNIACDMVIVAVLLWLLRATRSSSHAPSRALAAAPAGLYALAPLLEPFVFAKYDALPAALALGGLALFAARRPGLAGAALGLGATIKWTPLLAAPLLALHLIRERNWRELVLFTAGLLVSAAATSLPFALTNPAAFLLPYRLQTGREMTGESIWFLLALPLDPSLGDRLTAPWGHVSSAVMPVVLMSLVQGAALSLLILPLLLRPLALRRTLVLAALAPALFLVLNRVFSPQYLLPISVSALAALTLVQPGRRAVLAALAALALAQAANLLVWPFFQERWILANTLLFAVLLPLLIWLAFQAVRLPEEPLATREQRWDVVSEVSEHGQAAS